MTKNQRLRAEIAAGAVKYMHVAVQVSMGQYVDPVTKIVHENVPLRSEKGATAKRSFKKPKGKAMRQLREELKREAIAAENRHAEI